MATKKNIQRQHFIKPNCSIMKTKSTIILLFFALSALAQEWNVVEIGTCPQDKTYSILLADLHGDNLKRLYVSTRGEPTDGAIYEWTFNGVSWEMTSTVATGLRNLITLSAGDVKNTGLDRLYGAEWGGTNSKVYEFSWNGSGWDQEIVEATQSGMLSCFVSDAREEGVQRLYVGGFIIHREYTWTGSEWQIIDINTTYGTEGPAVFGNGKNDGILRYYTPGNRVREFSWDGAQYNETSSISNADGWPETLVVEKIRNDGLNRLLTQDANGIFEYTWNGTGWDEEFVDSRSGRAFLFAARTKSDGKYYVYSTDIGSSLREYNFNENTTSYEYSNIDAATGATALIDAGTGRNDNVVRLYTPSYSSGKIYEITNIDPLVIGSTSNKLFSSSQEHIKVYYMTNKLLIENNNGSGYMNIYDLNGRLVYGEKIQTETKSIDLNFLKSGIYIVKYFNNEITETKKIFAK